MTLYGDGLYGVGVYETPVSGVVQDTWPPRVLVTVTGLIFYAATGISILREVGGVRSGLRGAVGVATAGSDAFVRTDAELPFGVPVRYVAEITTAGGEFEVGSAPVTATITKVALSDAISGDAAQVVILAWADKANARQSSTFVVGGRNVVVSGPRSGFTASVDLMVETDSARESLADLLGTATSGVLQIRQQGGYGGVDSYVAVLSDTEHRFSQDGSDQRRRWTLDVVQTDGWPSALEAAGFTLEDLNEAYDVTLFGLSQAFPGTLLDIAQSEF